MRPPAPFASDRHSPASRARSGGEALQAAHGAGLIHRDLKPANVVVPPGERVKLLGLGLAKAVAEASGLLIAFFTAAATRPPTGFGNAPTGTAR